MRKIFTFLFILSIINTINAQNNVGIGTNNPDGTSKLDITATDKGLLPPRVALTSLVTTTPILNGAGTAATTADMPNGLIVFNTNTAGTAPNNVVPGYYYWDKPNNKWKAMFSSPGLIDIGTIHAFPGTTYPNDMYLPLSGSTYNKADYPEFTDILSSLDADLITATTATTFTLGNWNSNGAFLRGQGGNAGSLGAIQTDATKRPTTAFTTTSTTTGTTSSSTGGNTLGDQWLSYIDNCGGCGSYGGTDRDLSRGSSQWSNYVTTGYDDDPTQYLTEWTPQDHNHTIPSLSITGGGDVETRPTNRSILWMIKVRPSASYVGNMTVNNNTFTDLDWIKVGSTATVPTSTEDKYTQSKVLVGNTVGSSSTPNFTIEATGTGGPYSVPAIGLTFSPSKFLYLHAASGEQSIMWDATGALRFGTETSIGVSYSEKMRINSNGRVGIGTSSPANTLDVNGYVKLGTSGGADVEGSMRYNSTKKCMEFHNGCGWRCIGLTSTQIVDIFDGFNEGSQCNGGSSGGSYGNVYNFTVTGLQPGQVIVIDILFFVGAGCRGNAGFPTQSAKMYNSGLGFFYEDEIQSSPNTWQERHLKQSFTVPTSHTCGNNITMSFEYNGTFTFAKAFIEKF
ncbi:MAG: hypothetical protein K1X55_05375 [Chitinophagales bacterium]|nr:hypothetical protein [Chitinophagales bacterium]